MRPSNAWLERRIARRVETALGGIHPSTPVYRGVARPWQVGVILQHDRRLADRLIASFRAEGLNVGSDRPCSPDDGVYDTIERHGEARGLRCAMIEIRNDLAASRAGRRDWVEGLAPWAAALPPFPPCDLERRCPEP